MNPFAELNIVAVIVAAVAYFMIGWLWYSPMLFGNLYLKEMHADPKNIKMAGMGITFGTSFVLGVVNAITINVITIGVNAHTAGLGANLGLLLGVGLIVPVVMTDTLYDHRSTKLFLIKVGYNVVGFIAMGAILGAWR